jgi:hypothetical protein
MTGITADMQLASFWYEWIFSGEVLHGDTVCYETLISVCHCTLSAHMRVGWSFFATV